jgi:hypothetical protein
MSHDWVLNWKPTLWPSIMWSRCKCQCYAQDCLRQAQLYKTFTYTNVPIVSRPISSLSYRYHWKYPGKNKIFPSRQWYLKFDEVIKKFGFIENQVDNYIYIKTKGGKFIILVLYVDDILLASNDKNMLYETKNFLSSNFDMKDLGEASYVLGIEIHQDRTKGVLGLSHKKHILRKCLQGTIWISVLPRLYHLLREISLVISNVLRIS